jgi:hypothetical protein
MTRGGAAWKLVGLITRRSWVQIPPPLPNYIKGLEDILSPFSFGQKSIPHTIPHRASRNRGKESRKVPCAWWLSNLPAFRRVDEGGCPRWVSSTLAGQCLVTASRTTARATDLSDKPDVGNDVGNIFITPAPQPSANQPSAARPPSGPAPACRIRGPERQTLG